LASKLRLMCVVKYYHSLWQLSEHTGTFLCFAASCCHKLGSNTFCEVVKGIVSACSISCEAQVGRSSIWRLWGRCIANVLQYVSNKMHALHSLFISGNCSTYFGCYFHPSLGAHTTVSTASGICSSNGVTNTRCCRYNCLRSWWWVMVPPETCRAVFRYNKLCNVASCWTYIRIFLRWPINVKYIECC